MKKAFVISAASFIAIWAAVSASTKANAEDNEGGGVARYIRPAPVPLMQFCLATDRDR